MARILAGDYGRRDLLALGSPLVFTLRAWGYEVIEAENSLDVLHKASSERVCACVCVWRRMHTGPFPPLLFFLAKEGRLTLSGGFMCGMIMERDELVLSVPGKYRKGCARVCVET